MFETVFTYGCMYMYVYIGGETKIKAKYRMNQVKEVKKSERQQKKKKIIQQRKHLSDCCR